MKEKIDPQHYLTDALITSDEWDSFDYNLQLEIKELAEIGYDDKPQFWKNNLAFEYLYRAEKLLTERKKTGDHEIETIRELQNLVTKYEHLKTFLLTLRIATLVYRAGLIPELITEGEAHFDFRQDQSERGKKERARNGMNPSERKTRNDKIVEQYLAVKLRGKGTVTLNGFANKYSKKYGISPSAIKKILNKHLPKS